MRSSCGVGFCALAAVLFLAAAAPAATISEVLAGPFDPTAEDYELYFGHAPSGYLLTWDNSAGNLAGPNHSPLRAPYQGPAGGNPAWLKFDQIANSGGQGTSNTNLTTFTLGDNLGRAWEMDFSVLIFDKQFTGSEMKVIVVGEDATDQNNYRDAVLSDADVVAGVMLTWHIQADAGEEVTVYVQSIGDESYPCAFFMDNEAFGAAHAPEPATVVVLALGLVGMAMRRRR